MKRLSTLALLATAALSCTGERSSGVRAAAAVTPIDMDCAEQDCAWVLAEGACDAFAERYGLPGRPLVETRMSGVQVGMNELPTIDGTYVASVAPTGAFDWFAPRPVSFVVAIGAQSDSSIYAYSAAPQLRDAGLSPWNPPLAQILFCSQPDDLLTVSVTAGTAYTRAWGWQIQKAALSPTVTAAVGATVDAQYVVTVAAAPVDSEWLASGTITVRNATGQDATGVMLVAGLGGIALTPSCVNFDGTLAAGASLTCTWSAATGGALDATVIATVTYSLGGSISSISAVRPKALAPRALAATELSVSGGAPVRFGAPTSEVDPCVVVTDDRAGALGTACAATTPNRFAYTLPIGPYASCDSSGAGFSFSNTAAFAAPSGASGSATAVVQVLVPCASGGCTLTQGYWKTHSREGPAPYDARWKNLGALEEDTEFFSSGRTWIELFRTPVRRSAYVALAHQYMAAKLNVLAGASGAALGDALATAEAFFSATSPAARLTTAQRDQALVLASLLEAFNSGAVGPGHCDDVEHGTCRDDEGGDACVERCVEEKGHDDALHERCLEAGGVEPTVKEASFRKTGVNVLCETPEPPPDDEDLCREHQERDDELAQCVAACQDSCGHHHHRRHHRCDRHDEREHEECREHDAKDRAYGCGDHGKHADCRAHERSHRSCEHD
jgi:hypothetical protein